MQYKADTADEYIAALPPDRAAVISNLRKLIVKNLPKGFKESTSYGMMGWSVPHSLYPSGYHCTPEQPLPFIGLASQKNFIALYHMGIYANPKLLKWFTDEYPKYSKRKLDMGKSCIRFKYMDDIPYDLIAELAMKMTPQEWIACYENGLSEAGIKRKA